MHYTDDLVFSWAENQDGKLVHVDSVPNGLACKCICPCCHEELVARHGDIKQHGFAHHSKVRKANLRICYMVTVYKLAEQIIQTRKTLRVPTYYGFFPERNIEFVDIQVDSRYEREDKQPDVIATTANNERYLIDFLFDERNVYHKCASINPDIISIQIDLTNHTLEDLESFLLCSSKDRKWVCNNIYLKEIEERCRKKGKPIRLVTFDTCNKCVLISNCCAAKYKGRNSFIAIQNSDETFFLCQTDLYKLELEKIEKKKVRIGQVVSDFDSAMELSVEPLLEYKDRSKKRVLDNIGMGSVNRTCYNCENNLAWANKDGYANCGRYCSLNIPCQISPDYAKECKGFRPKK